MKAIREVNEQTLRWTQPGAFQRDYELRAGDEVLATLRWQKAFGSLALAEAASGKWTFKRSGFLRPKVTVRVPTSETEVAVFTAGWGGEGTLRLPNGRCYHWQSTNFWQSQWAFADEAGEPLIQFKAEYAFFKLAAEVDVKPGAVGLPDLSLLAALGWYLMVLLSDDTAGAAAGGAAGT